MHALTALRIEDAKSGIAYVGKPHHEHDDCIRIAYEWLDAQIKIKSVRRVARPFKHIIEAWAARYVSQHDVEVAARLHPDVFGSYPWFNISARLILPSEHRLAGIEEAGKHPSYRSDLRYDLRARYRCRETIEGSLERLACDG